MKFINKLILLPWFIIQSKKYMKGNKLKLNDWYRAIIRWFYV